MTIKTLIYTICYNNERDIESWLNAHKDADKIFVVDLCSTDNSIEVMSEDERVICRAPGLILEGQSLAELLTFTKNLAQEFLLSHKKEDEEWILLNVNINETLEENWNSILKELCKDKVYNQFSFIQSDTSYFCHLNVPSIKGCSLYDENDFLYYNGSHQLIENVEEDSVLKTTIKLLCNDTLKYVNVIQKNEFDSFLISEPFIGDFYFTRKLIKYCIDNEDVEIFTKIFRRVKNLCFSYNENIFNENIAISMYFTYAYLLITDSYFFSENKLTNFRIINKMSTEKELEFKNNMFLFKFIPYEIAIELTKEAELTEESKQIIVNYLTKALNTSSNNNFGNYIIDIGNSYNSTIENLIEEYSN